MHRHALAFALAALVLTFGCKQEEGEVCQTYDMTSDCAEGLECCGSPRVCPGDPANAADVRGICLPSGMCPDTVERVCPTDAGTDAAVDSGIDSGAAVDAGPVTDSGPADSGPTDSGPADSGPTDSGPTDSGPVDSGPVDSGPVDSGPVDSGPVDSGPVDSGVDSGA
ncbi:MAG: hypothetical protein AB8I08_05205 [Sandaracinaceae bacterium]